MSDGNGYDARGEDQAIRVELQAQVEHSAATDRRVSELASEQSTTLDRIAVGLGRISTLEEKINRLLVIAGEKP